LIAIRGAARGHSSSSAAAKIRRGTVDAPFR
jgi:hypothetical protein